MLLGVTVWRAILRESLATRGAAYEDTLASLDRSLTARATLALKSDPSRGGLARLATRSHAAQRGASRASRACGCM